MKMKYKLFEEVMLTQNYPNKGLQKGDVATIVDYHEAPNYENGYSLEVFNALGKTLTIVSVPESSICSFSEDDIFQSRHLKAA